MGRVALGLLGTAGALALVVLVAPLAEDVRYALYLIVGAVSVVAGWYGLWRHRPRRRLAWVLVLTGWTTRFAGDVAWVLENVVSDAAPYPGVADALYVAGYLTMPLGVLAFARGGASERDRSVALDALIVSVGVAVPTAVFLLVPALLDASMSGAAQAVTAFYPLADVFLVTVLFRLLVAPGGRRPATVLTAASLVGLFLGDSAYNTLLLAAPDLAATAPVDVLYLAAYVCAGAAACHPSMVAMTHARGGQPRMTRGRLVALTTALTLPGLTLLLDGLQDRDIAWGVLGVGSMALSALVYVRMAGLLDRVEAQASQLAAQARVDALTGAANRRSWDFELDRAVARAGESRAPLAVALLDLDHFKHYNDSHGHQAGDHLLAAAVAA